jgi:hypothetical protein
VSCERAPTCTSDLSGTGTGDFSISFTLTTTSTSLSAVVCQRAACEHSQFWDVRLHQTGQVIVELDDGGGAYMQLLAGTNVNDGAPHDVAVCRKSGQVYAFVDGVLANETANATPLSTLPPLVTSTSVCTGIDGTVALDGSLTNLCVGAL